MRKAITLLLILSALSAYASGGSESTLYTSRSTDEAYSISSALYSLGNLYAYLDAYCIYPADVSKMEEEMAAAMISSLGDPYSYYIPAEDAEEYTDATAGSYIGIGIYLTKFPPFDADLSDPESWMITIASVFPSSPAERAGLRARDMISHINGESVAPMTAVEASKALRGKSGEDITLRVHRGSADFDITLRPERIITPTADSAMLSNGIGYLAIYSFTMTTAESVEKELRSLISSGADSLIIDLRNNHGGTVDGALDIADMFLKEGLMLTTEFKKGSGRNNIVSRADSGLLVPEAIPVVILINGGTASSSEILTAALKENGRAQVVGSRSFGKGISQEVRPFSEGYIQVTTAHFYTPGGHDIHEKGIEPDYVIEEPEFSDEAMAAYERLMEEDPFDSYIEERPEYSKENIEAFAELYKDSGVPDQLLKLLIRNEYIYQLDYDDRPIADPDYDEVLQKAMELLS